MPFLTSELCSASKNTSEKCISISRKSLEPHILRLILWKVTKKLKFFKNTLKMQTLSWYQEKFWSGIKIRGSRCDSTIHDKQLKRSKQFLSSSIDQHEKNSPLCHGPPFACGTQSKLQITPLFAFFTYFQMLITRSRIYICSPFRTKRRFIRKGTLYVITIWLTSKILGLSCGDNYLFIKQVPNEH